ncbi:hypothetical protein D3C72_1921290 [compost metagenome]
MLDKISLVAKAINIGNFRLATFDFQFPVLDQLAGQCRRAQTQPLNCIRNRVFISIMRNVADIEQQAITSIKIIGFSDLVAEPVVAGNEIGQKLMQAYIEDRTDVLILQSGIDFLAGLVTNGTITIILGQII